MHPLLGRFQSPEPLSALARLHFHDPSKTTLRKVDHEPRVAVLDQSDLLAQGIRCSRFIPGATDVDALGSCTANTAIEALSNLLCEGDFADLTGKLAEVAPGEWAADPDPDAYTDTAAAERAAIEFYHGSTDLTDNPATEWPPTDGGSSGPIIERYAQDQRLISAARIAHGAENICSLMQTDGCLLGMPWCNSMFEPDAQGFIDGNGTITAIETALASGVAGGHEIYLSAIERITVLPSGQVDSFKTVLRARNHWKASWGLHGSFLLHLSLLAALGSHIDVRQFIA